MFKKNKVYKDAILKMLNVTNKSIKVLFSGPIHSPNIPMNNYPNIRSPKPESVGMIGIQLFISNWVDK